MGFAHRLNSGATLWPEAHWGTLKLWLSTWVGLPLIIRDHGHSFYSQHHQLLQHSYVYLRSYSYSIYKDSLLPVFLYWRACYRDIRVICFIELFILLTFWVQFLVLIILLCSPLFAEPYTSLELLLPCCDGRALRDGTHPFPFILDVF
jgi:hypothetical protein